MKQEFVIAGLGGQGVLFLTKILSLAADAMGLPFIGSEIHGMSQRGGSVVSHLKTGDFFSPLVRKGRAHILFSLEVSETYRNLDFLRPSGKIYTLVSGKDFPEEPVKTILAEKNISIFNIDIREISLEAGTSANLILLGLYAATDEKIFTKEVIEKAISKIGSKKVIQKNIEAFYKGIHIAG